MPQGFFRVELTMDVRPGSEDEFEDAWMAVGAAVAQYPDNLDQWLSRSREAPGRYVIASDWPDEDAFRRFEKAPGHAELTGKLRELRTSGSMATMTVLHHLPGVGST